MVSNGSHAEKVKRVLQKMTTDGLLTTVEAVRAKLVQPNPLGYSNVGVVVDVNSRELGRCDSVKVGDRLASTGAHAEMVAVPENLAAQISLA